MKQPPKSKIITENLIEDNIKFSVPLFIRILEYAKESAKNDLVLHEIAERAQNLTKSGVEVLGVKNYHELVPEDKLNENILNQLSERKITLEYHHELNPKIFDGDKLKPNIREALLKFANKWIEFAKIPKNIIKDIVATGGNMNYNYTPFSDIDCHILIDKNMVKDIPRETFDELMQSKKELWTLKHSHITMAGYQIEPYAQDINEPVPSNQGQYSVLHDKWNKKPTHEDVDFEHDKILEKKADYYEDLINNMIKVKAPVEQFAALKDKFKNLRNDVRTYGEFSHGNLLFKEVRNRGVLQKMTEYINDSTDKDLSVENI